MKETKKVQFEDKSDTISINTRMANLRVKKSIHDFPVYPILKRDKVELLTGSLNTLKLRHRPPPTTAFNNQRPRSTMEQANNNQELAPIREEEPITRIKSLKS